MPQPNRRVAAPLLAFAIGSLLAAPAARAGVITYAGPVGAPVTATAGAGAGSVSLTVTTGVPAFTTIVVFVGTNLSTSAIAGVSDSAGDTFDDQWNGYASTGIQYHIFQTRSGSLNPGGTITVSWPAGETGKSIVMSAYQFYPLLDHSAGNDQVAQDTQTSGPPTATAGGATSQAAELLTGLCVTNGAAATFTSTSGDTLLSSVSLGPIVMTPFWRELSATTTPTVSGTLSAGAPWVIAARTTKVNLVPVTLTRITVD